MIAKHYIPLLLCLLLFLGGRAGAQSKVSVQLGSTFSQTRALYDKQQVQPGPYFHELVDLSILVGPHIYFEYEYTFRKLHLSTGFGFTNFGAGKIPFIGAPRWYTPYWMVPLLAGYRLKLPSQWALIVEGGGDIGFSDKSNSIIRNGGSYWGNINAVVGIEVEYRRCRLGIRGHWGLTDFRYFNPITYKHTAVSTYLSYTLWDQAKVKQRHLEREQAKRLGQ